MNTQPDPSYIMQTATGFWASKALLTAVELNVFTCINDHAYTADELGEMLGLHPRGTYDFFDALVALKFLEREGDGPNGKYRNTLDTYTFLNKNSPTYLGGLAEMLNARLFGFWNDLGAALKSGKPQNEVKHNGKPLFAELYANEVRLVQFLEAMSSVQMGNFLALAEVFDFTRYDTVTDVGGALALLSRVIGARHSHLHLTSFDLPPVVPHAQKQVDKAEMADRIRVIGGDFFKDPIPDADVVTMGNILHDWNLTQKKILIKKAYDALPTGGAFIVIENLIDDKRRENAFGLLMSLNMLIETGDGFDYTFANFKDWCNECGFSRYEIFPLAGPTYAAVAYK